MSRNDAFNGWALMLISSVAWCYYTFWVLVRPSPHLAASAAAAALQLAGACFWGAVSVLSAI